VTVGARSPGPGLIDRNTERIVLDQFIAGVRASEGQALVVRGDPGVGKTTLLDYLAGQAAGCRVVRATGVQSARQARWRRSPSMARHTRYNCGACPTSRTPPPFCAP
jgi:predicted ATP-dependent serine protease